MVTKVVSYAACDGAVFSTEEEALEYEKKRAEEIYGDIGRDWFGPRDNVSLLNLLSFIELHEEDIKDYLMFTKSYQNSK